MTNHPYSEDELARYRSRIEAAQRNLEGVTRRTVLAPFRALSNQTGVPTWLKAEHRQVGGSFKIRGAFQRMLSLSEDQKAAGVVAASAGNHAQGVAIAASRLGIEAVVYMPTTAALPKVDATRSYGARVELMGTSVDDAIKAAHEDAQSSGRTFIHPFDHEEVIIGQATAAAEILEQEPNVKTIVVPTGGGGLLAGTILAVAAFGSDAQVVGVQAAGAAAFPRSLALGEPTRAAELRTMADGIAVGMPGEVTFDIIARSEVPIVTVSEDQIARAVLALIERAKMVVEPAGAAGVAGLLTGEVAPGDPTVVITSGGNVDPLVLMRIMQHGMVAAGRYMRLHLRVSDSPGELAALLAQLARLGANVLSVSHHRIAPTLAVGQVDVELELETRGTEHAHGVHAQIQSAGYEFVASQFNRLDAS